MRLHSVAEIVTLVVASVGAGDRVLADIDGPLAAVRPGNFHDENGLLADRHDPNLIVGEQVDADLAPVIEEVPDRLAGLGGVGQPTDCAVVLDPQEDAAAIRVRHAGVGFPHATGHAVPGRLEFEVGLFADRER